MKNKNFSKRQGESMMVNFTLMAKKPRSNHFCDLGSIVHYDNRLRMNKKRMAFDDYEIISWVLERN